MTRTINLTTTYSHPVQKVWKALTDKTALSQWLMPTDFEPVVGHKFQFKTKPQGNFDGIVNCEVLEIVEEEKLSFSWSAGKSMSTIVVFELTAVGNETRLDFQHKGFEGLFNRLIARNILAAGWKRKILTKLLPEYLAK
ncbi:MAG: SRPBCC domain-containing protein [Bacteroidia bacterium]|nr:SRPBCC domain-containing protein [Bacteroidia bacterium]